MSLKSKTTPGLFMFEVCFRMCKPIPRGTAWSMFQRFIENDTLRLSHKDSVNGPPRWSCPSESTALLASIGIVILASEPATLLWRSRTLRNWVPYTTVGLSVILRQLATAVSRIVSKQASCRLSNQLLCQLPNTFSSWDKIWRSVKHHGYPFCSK